MSCSDRTSPPFPEEEEEEEEEEFPAAVARGHLDDSLRLRFWDDGVLGSF